MRALGWAAKLSCPNARETSPVRATAQNRFSVPDDEHQTIFRLPGGQHWQRCRLEAATTPAKYQSPEADLDRMVWRSIVGMAKLVLGVLLFSGGACRLGLARQFVRSLPVASREVKWNEAGDAGSFGDITRLARR
jgi:hypothetical protein